MADNQSNSKQPNREAELAKNTLLLSVGSLLSKGINFIMVPLFSRWVTASEYGIYDLYCTYAMLLIPFISLACSEALFRFGIETNTREEITPFVSSAFAIDFLGYCVAAIILSVLGIVCSWNLALPFSLMLLGELGMNHLQGVLRALKKLPLYSLISIIVTCLMALITTLLVLVAGFGLMGIILGYAFGYIGGCLIGFIRIRYWELIRPSQVRMSVVREMVRYSAPLIPNNISWWVISVSDRIIINIFLGPISNGIYAIASKLSNFCASIFGVFNMSWQQSASETADDAEKNRYYNTVLNNLICLMVSLSSTIVLLNYPLFDLIFDHQYFEGMFYFPILATSVAANSLVLYFGGLQISIKQPAANGITTAIGAIVNVSVNLLLIPVFGLFVAAASTLLSNILMAFLRWILLRKTFAFSLNHKTLLLLISYCYFFAMSYVCQDYPLIIVNLGAALAIAFIANRKLLRLLLRRKRSGLDAESFR